MLGMTPAAPMSVPPGRGWENSTEAGWNASVEPGKNGCPSTVDPNVPSAFCALASFALMAAMSSPRHGSETFAVSPPSASIGSEATGETATPPSDS